MSYKQTLNRRVFLKGVVGGTAGIVAGCWINFAPANAANTLAPDDLSGGFLNPPDDTRPWVYWFWINGNISREGITADLEAMQRVGIGGVLIMEVDGSPQGPVAFGTENWKEMFRFACVEANRLSLEITMNDGAGWTGSGGPWNTPENSMQRVYHSEITVDGGQVYSNELPQPNVKNGKAESSVQKSKAGQPEYYRDIAIIAFPTPTNTGYKNEDIDLKAGYIAGSTPPSVKTGGVGRFKVFPVSIDPAPPTAVIDQNRIIDLTGHFSNGRLTWDVPPGNWTITRFGHGSTGATNHPAPTAGMGLECDKMSKEAVENHFNKFIGEVMKLAGSLTGKTLVGTHVDSWEVGGQSWTKAFPEEFKKRCGYDITPFLPAMTGRIIGSAEITERFLWDLRFTISELIAENYAGHMRELSNRHGITFSMEAIDNTPFDEIRVAGQANLPQTEFWYRRETEAAGESGDCFPGVYRSYAWTPAMVSAAHIYGRQIIPSEAFTANRGENWLAHPALLKPQGDWAFCSGINRFIFHRYAMQPWLNRKPGMTMAFWGIHYERTQTWWEETKPWHEYLTRCQYMLQKGLFVADILYMQAEAVPNRFIPPGTDFANPIPPDPPGYNFDGCTADVVFNRITIKDGRIMLPDGMSYRLMVLPSRGEQVMAGVMTIKLARKIEELVNEGMVIVGPPPVRTPGLTNYPENEEELKENKEKNLE
ncbi:MAG: glycosyl hydrolase, partial [Mariniphaga sp.]